MHAVTESYEIQVLIQRRWAVSAAYICISTQWASRLRRMGRGLAILGKARKERWIGTIEAHQPSTFCLELYCFGSSFGEAKEADSLRVVQLG